jgi:chromosome segregation ATPase
MILNTVIEDVVNEIKSGKKDLYETIKCYIKLIDSYGDEEEKLDVIIEDLEYLIEELKITVKNQEKEIREYKETVEDSNYFIEELNITVKNLEEEIDNLEQEREKLKEYIQKVEGVIV